MQNYGITYQGSKGAIAEVIINRLPTGERFCDLFGGGFAMSHCALLSGRFNKVLYNDINPLVVDLVKRAILGEFRNYKGKFIDRQKFKELKDRDGFVKYVWSFGCGGNAYLYSKEIEPWKKALHNVRVLNDFTDFEKFGIQTDGSCKDIREHHEEYKPKYIEWYLKNIMQSGDIDVEELKKDLMDKIAGQKEELRLYLVDALKKSSLKAVDIDKRLKTHMSGHYFSKSQWQFPTEAEYDKMQEFMPLKPYAEVYGYFDFLQSLQRLQITTQDYLDYEYKAGDVVYCDIPYENTAQYDNEFNHAKFYEWADSRPYPVYISSYNISDKRFEKILEIEKRALFSGASSKKVKECLFVNRAGKQFEERFLKFI